MNTLTLNIVTPNGAVYEREDIELAVLLAMWLSFTQSEIRGLTKSKSIDGDYITIKIYGLKFEGER